MNSLAGYFPYNLAVSLITFNRDPSLKPRTGGVFGSS